MQLKAEFLNIASIKLNPKLNIETIIQKIDHQETLTFDDFHQSLAPHISKTYMENDSFCLFVILKLILEPDNTVMSKNNFETENTIKFETFKIFLYIQTLKNNLEKKGMKTAWNNPENLNDSFHPTKTLSHSNQKVTNMFSKLARFESDIDDVVFMLRLKDMFINTGNEFKQKVLGAPNFEISYSNYHQTQNLNGKTIVIESSNKSNLIITDCQNSSIYVKDVFGIVYIYKCKNCEIFISGVKQIAMIENSNDLQISLITKALMLSNITDSTLNLYSVFNPFLFGEIINITLGPFNGNFGGIWNMMEKCEIEADFLYLSSFAHPMCFYKAQVGIDIEANSFKIQDINRFIKITLPTNFGAIGVKELQKDFNFSKIAPEAKKYLKLIDEEGINLPILVPNNYLDAYVKRILKHKRLRDIIKKRGFSKEEEIKYLNAIQGHFREWLIAKPQTNHLFRLINSIK